MVSAAYYFTVADLVHSGVAVNRDAAVAPVIFYQTFMYVDHVPARGEQLRRPASRPRDVPLAGRA
jgi:hypothetical protein